MSLAFTSGRTVRGMYAGAAELLLPVLDLDTRMLETHVAYESGDRLYAVGADPLVERDRVVRVELDYSTAGMNGAYVKKSDLREDPDLAVWQEWIRRLGEGMDMSYRAFLRKSKESDK